MTETPCGDGADARYCETFWAQNAELEALRAKVSAAEHFADIWRGTLPELPDAYMCTYTCPEANAAADLYRALGDEGTAVCILANHAHYDEDGDEHYGWKPPAAAANGTLRAEIADLREKLRVVIDETPPELRYDWADQYLSALLPGEEVPQRVKIAGGRHVPLYPDECEPHTPGQPDGVAQWHEWREEMEKTHVQRQCKGCGLWAIWEPKPAEPAASERPDGACGHAADSAEGAGE